MIVCTGCGLWVQPDEAMPDRCRFCQTVLVQHDVGDVSIRNEYEKKLTRKYEQETQD